MVDVPPLPENLSRHRPGAVVALAQAGVAAAAAVEASSSLLSPNGGRGGG